MSALVWLDPHGAPEFPPLDAALTEADGADGLLAAGGALSPAWLLAAYRRGIFPWFSGDQPILWWSPDPRLVLFPEHFRCHRSLARVLKQGVFSLRQDTAFDQVIAHCAQTPRPGQNGTWITPEMQAAYRQMHALGVAHSFEAWQDGRLVGGLYGLRLGRVFFGESMFSHVSNASKAALAHLVDYARAEGIVLIDCQVRTEHLVSLGAEEITRAQFAALLARHVGAV